MFNLESAIKIRRIFAGFGRIPNPTESTGFGRIRIQRFGRTLGIVAWYKKSFSEKKVNITKKPRSHQVPEVYVVKSPHKSEEIHFSRNFMKLKFFPILFKLSEINANDISLTFWKFKQNQKAFNFIGFFHKKIRNWMKNPMK